MSNITLVSPSNRTFLKNTTMFHAHSSFFFSFHFLLFLSVIVVIMEWGKNCEWVVLFHSLSSLYFYAFSVNKVYLFSKDKHQNLLDPRYCVLHQKKLVFKDISSIFKAILLLQESFYLGYINSSSCSTFKTRSALVFPKTPPFFFLLFFSRKGLSFSDS